MKPNPQNYEPWIDPNGGEWIRVKSGYFKDVVWRPTDMSFGEEAADGTAPLSFQCEFFGKVPEKAVAFEKVATSIVRDILTVMVENDKNG